jgi:hypothetical protein
MFELIFFLRNFYAENFQRLPQEKFLRHSNPLKFLQFSSIPMGDLSMNARLGKACQAADDIKASSLETVD